MQLRHLWLANVAEQRAQCRTRIVSNHRNRCSFVWMVMSVTRWTPASSLPSGQCWQWPSSSGWCRLSVLVVEWRTDWTERIDCSSDGGHFVFFGRFCIWCWARYSPTCTGIEWMTPEWRQRIWVAEHISSQVSCAICCSSDWPPSGRESPRSGRRLSWDFSAHRIDDPGGDFQRKFASQLDAFCCSAFVC